MKVVGVDWRERSGIYSQVETVRNGREGGDGCGEEKVYKRNGGSGKECCGK